MAAAAPFDEAEKAQAEAKLKELNAAPAPPPPVPVPPVPAAPQPAPPPAATVWRYRVIDIHAVYAQRRDLVRLSENVSAIQAEIKAGMRACPGLEIWSETVAKV